MQYATLIIKTPFTQEHHNDCYCKSDYRKPMDFMFQLRL